MEYGRTRREMMDTALRPIVAITQARVGSTRLPAKVLRPIGGKPMLWWHLKRLAQAETLDEIVVATTHEPGADQIAAIARDLNIAVFQGPEHDVLARYAGAATLMSARTIVRVTSDCPLIDPTLIDLTVRAFVDTMPDCRYVALSAEHFPRGLDCEVFSADALIESADLTSDPSDREHVTPFIRRDHRYAARWLLPEMSVAPQRWCVDTAEDLALVTHVIEALGRDRTDFGWHEILAVIDANPHWHGLNAHIQQKHG